jgi:hypothetical protein
MFKNMRYGLRLSQRSLKMGFSGFPPPRRRRGDSKDRPREAENRPEHNGSGVREFTKQRIQPRSLLLLTEHHQTLGGEYEHPPGTHGVRLTAARKPIALLIENCQGAVAITGVGHLPKKRSRAKSSNKGTFAGFV